MINECPTSPMWEKMFQWVERFSWS